MKDPTSCLNENYSDDLIFLVCPAFNALLNVLLAHFFQPKSLIFYDTLDKIWLAHDQIQRAVNRWIQVCDNQRRLFDLSKEDLEKIINNNSKNKIKFFEFKKDLTGVEKNNPLREYPNYNEVIGSPVENFTKIKEDSPCKINPPPY